MGTVCPAGAKREVDLHCIDSQDDLVSQRIEDALDAGTSSSLPLNAGKRAVARTDGSPGTLSAICP